MSGQSWDHRKTGGDIDRLEPTAAPAAASMRQLHPDPDISRSLYQRHVQRRAAARVASPPPALLEQPDSTAAPAVQRKGKDADPGATATAAEGPSAGQVGSATIHALQSHMKLTAMRMYAVAANMHTILGQPSNTAAGIEPTVQALQQQYDTIMNDLDRLHGEIARVPQLMRGAMSEEIALLRGAWYANNGLNRALSSVYGFTHDKDGRPLADAGSFTGNISAVQGRLSSIFGALHVDEGDIKNQYLERGADVADALGAATSEAFDAGLSAIKTCARRLMIDLESMDDKDADVTAADLMAAASATAASAKGIDAKNLGAAKKAVHDVEALQAELAKRPGPKVARLAKLIGYNSSVSSNLYILHQRMNQVAGEHGRR